jgi:MFS family permease
VRRPPTFPIVLAGFSAFLDLYNTQPLLPLLARTFHASHSAVTLTVTAPTIAVALAAPMAGRLADRAGMRRTIVWSAFALAATTALGATAHTLGQLVFWRFVQGAVSPGVFSIAIAYIHEEWPAANTGSATAAYVGGTVVGGFVGRATTGVIASVAAWQAAFAVLSAINAAAAIVLWRRLPRERGREPGRQTARGGSFAAHARDPRLVPTYIVGFCILCAQIATFTYVTFHLAAPPYSLSTAALGWIFVTYLLGAVLTPAAGRWIDRYGRRAAFLAATAVGIAAMLLTLAPSLAAVLVGLSCFATSVFITQATASSQVGATAEFDRGLALGLYATWYYVGGSIGGELPSLFWAAGGWPACVVFVVVVQIAMMSIAAWVW